MSEAGKPEMMRYRGVDARQLAACRESECALT